MLDLSWFSRFFGLLGVLEGRRRASLRRSWGVLGRLEAVLRRLGRDLEAIFWRLGAVLRQSGPVWERLGGTGPNFVAFFLILDDIW